MSSVVVVDRPSEFLYRVHTPIKSKSCPVFGYRQVVRREGPVELRAVRELISTGRVNFVCIDDSTNLYCGRVVQAKAVKTLAQEMGYRVFKSVIYICCDDSIPAGTVYVQLTTHDPVLKGI